MMTNLLFYPGARHPPPTLLDIVKERFLKFAVFCKNRLCVHVLGFWQEGFANRGFKISIRVKGFLCFALGIRKMLVGIKIPCSPLRSFNAVNRFSSQSF